MNINNLKILRYLYKEKEIEKKVDTMATIVGRNKLVAPATSGIDEVMATAKKLNISYVVHGFNDETIIMKKNEGPILRKFKK